MQQTINTMFVVLDDSNLRENRTKQYSCKRVRSQLPSLGVFPSTQTSDRRTTATPINLPASFCNRSANTPQ